MSEIATLKTNRNASFSKLTRSFGFQSTSIPHFFKTSAIRCACVKYTNEVIMNSEPKNEKIVVAQIEITDLQKLKIPVTRSLIAHN